MSKAKSRKAGPKKRTPPPVVMAKPRPWGLIAATLAMVLFAGGVIGYAVYQNANAASDDPADMAEAASKIKGVTAQDFPSQQHSQNTVAYESRPPFGGEHDPEWADCTGTVYDQPIRDENAVHALEHGAVWIAYSPDLSDDEVDTLKDKVDGENYMLMSPYPDLKNKVSLQAWGFQLAVDSVDDSRIDEFIRDLRSNPTTAPESNGSCVNPNFKQSPRPPDAVQPQPPVGTPSTAPTSSTPPTNG